MINSIEPDWGEDEEQWRQEAKSAILSQVEIKGLQHGSCRFDADMVDLTGHPHQLPHVSRVSMS
jgi:hypothetical protein